MFYPEMNKKSGIVKGKEKDNVQNGQNEKEEKFQKAISRLV